MLRRVEAVSRRCASAPVPRQRQAEKEGRMELWAGTVRRRRRKENGLLVATKGPPAAAALLLYCTRSHKM